MPRVDRPIFRRFIPRFRERAAAHARAGGVSVIAPEDGRLELFLPIDAADATNAAYPPGRISELGLWALLAIEQKRWRRLTEGPEKGLATAFVSGDFVDVVLDMCERDSVHPGPTRALDLDCLACGACCHEANVELAGPDLARWKKAGREELGAANYVRRRRDGKVVLRFAKDGRCQHLGHDNGCAIYELRPDNCRAFPVGSECCLAAREQSFGWIDV